MATLTVPAAPAEPIAIIGIGCRFPAGCDTPAAFWNFLMRGGDAVREVPPDRWSLASYYDNDRDKPGKTYTRWGCFLDQGLELFDAAFFGISPREAARVDPQQRLLLETAWEALEDAGLPAEKLAGQKVAVYVGLYMHDYENMQLRENAMGAMDGSTGTGTMASIAANRLSYVFDFHGPSVTIDTACSSSLVAIHWACHSLRHEGCPVALAGGVNIVFRPEMTVAMSRAAMLSPDGHCKSFDAAANGFVRGEGAGVVVLKRLSQALADGDAIYAVIRGSAVTQDGHTVGMTVPNGAAQAAAVREACDQGGVQPAEIQYIEAHGTGTAVGDPIEAEALGQTLGLGRVATTPCLIGSVKTNIGHLESAAGIAGLIKLVLALKHQVIPRNLHFNTPNPKIDFEGLRLRVVQQRTPWPVQPGQPRLGGINSFGFGGTNAHVIVEGPEAYVSAQATNAAPNMATTDHHLLVLSARSREALRALASAYTHFLETTNTFVTDICHSVLHHRSHHDQRLAVVGATNAELAEQLQAFLAEESRPNLHVGRAARQTPAVVFVYTGNGPQWWGMGRELLATQPIFRQAVEACAALFAQHASWALMDEILASEETSRLNETQIGQPAMFALQVGLTALLQAWGVTPSMIVGHSLGEVAAAYAAGALSLADAVRVVFHRGRLQQQLAGHGRLLSVGLGPAEAEEVLHAYAGQVEIAAINSPQSVTLVGDVPSLQALEQALAVQQVFCRFVPGNIPFHGRQMEPLMPVLAEVLTGLAPRPTQVPMLSSVTGAPIAGEALGADYWPQNLRQPVRFAPAVQTLIQQGHTLFLEIGPHPVLAHALRECLTHAHAKGHTVTTLRRLEPEQAALLGTLGQLYTLGYAANWATLYPPPQALVRLPTYPWQRESYWNETEEARQLRLGLATGRAMLGQATHPLLGHPLKLAQAAWDHVWDLDQEPFAYLRDHKVQGAVIVPGAAYVEMALAAARAVLGPQRPFVLEKVEFQRALFLPEAEPPTVQFVLDAQRTMFDVFSRPPGAAEGHWTHHVTGRLIHNVRGKAPKALSLEEIRQRCTEEIAGSTSYAYFHQSGLGLGPHFQGLRRLWGGVGEALGEIHFTLPATILADYLWHPILLDAAFQVLLGTLSLLEQNAPRFTYLPTQIDRVEVYALGAPQVWGYVRLQEQKATHIKGDIFIFDEQGQVLAEVQGLLCRALPQTDNTRLAKGQDVYTERWVEKPLLGLSQSPRFAHFLLTPAQIVERVQPLLSGFYEQVNLRYVNEEFTPAGRYLVRLYIVQALIRLGWQPLAGQRFTTKQLAQQLQVVPQHQRQFNLLLNCLAQDGALRRHTRDWEVVNMGPLEGLEDPAVVWRAMLQQFPGCLAELTLVRRCGMALAEVLQGTANPLELIFPSGSATSAHLYQDAPLSRFYNLTMQQVVRTLVEHLPPNRTLRILEIGAGTGGTAAYLLPHLLPTRTEYVFTDAGKLFLTQAEDRFHAFPFVHYQVLDIEQDPLAQGFEPHNFDVIVAADVVHATRNLRHTLGHIKQLLAADGLLLMIELVNPYRLIDLVFGLLKGWWAFSDTALRPTHACLSVAQWEQVLMANGFHAVAHLVETDPNQAVQAVLIARGPQALPPIAPPTPPKTAEAGRWLIFADEATTVSGQLTTLLQQAKGEVVLVTPHSQFAQLAPNHYGLDPHTPADFAQLVAQLQMAALPWQGIVHCWSLIAPNNQDFLADNRWVAANALGVLSLVHLTQGLIQNGGAQWPPLWVITSGAQPVTEAPVTLSQTAVKGLLRTLRLEQPQWSLCAVDLSAAPTAAEVRALFAELWTTAPETEVALRGAARLARRLQPTRSADLRTPQYRWLDPLNQPRRFLQWHFAEVGNLDSLTLRTLARRLPGPGEVEVEVYAAGVNFRDVAFNMFLHNTDSPLAHAIGMECAGRVAAVGAGVTAFGEGDAVMGLGWHSYGRYVITQAPLLVPKPPDLSYEEAATIPVAFLTAYYAMHRLARIQSGERVLIHAAGGGVGWAALQIARAAGAKIYATAGSPEKRQVLQGWGVAHVMDSRALTFADEIMALTQQLGVDVVLNSLAGEAAQKSLAILAPGGRFVEIGKRDVEQNSRLELRLFRQGLSFHFFDLERVAPPLIGQTLREIMQRFADGTYQPLPYRVFPAELLGQALDYLAKARHLGKVVMAMRNLVHNPQWLTPMLTLSATNTYLITGGLGGLGLALAHWLVQHGARHLMLVGRSGVATPEAQTQVTELQTLGATVTVAKADMTQADQVAQVLAHIRLTHYPLGGIIHAAMVLDDASVGQMTATQFDHAFAPKAQAAWQLHTQTLTESLEFFVLCSSMVGTVGNPGQGNYAAGNTFLAALAHYRQALGLPALVVHWGALAEVGYVAQNPAVSHRLAQAGLSQMPLRQALHLLGELMGYGATEATVSVVEWERWLSTYGGEQPPTYVAELGQRAAPLPVHEHPIKDQVAVLQITDPTERWRQLLLHISEQVARVMGIATVKLDREAALTELGLDSLMAVELSNRLNRNLGLNFSLMQLLSGLSVQQMAELMQSQAGGNAPGNGLTPNNN